MKKDKKQEKDINFINYFLDRPININEFANLNQLINEVLEKLRFDVTKKRLSKFNIELVEENDKIYKEININDKSISVTLCQNITNDYFIATNIMYNNDKNIEFSKKLVRTEYPRKNTFIELAMKKWQYNGMGLDINNFELTESNNYIETLPIYSYAKLTENNNIYIKCLSKNQK